jgi:two-component system NtrC family sensor kinase
MTPSVFRPIRVAAFSFLALIVLGLVLSAWLTVREQLRLREAQTQIVRMHRFHYLHLSVSTHVRAMAQGDRGELERRDQVVAQIDELKTLAANPETSVRLEAFRVRLLETKADDHGGLIETLVDFQEVAILEQAGHEQLLAGLRQQTETQLKLHLAAPLAILAVGLLLYPVARRRIFGPLDAFGRQLTELAAGDFSTLPTDDVDPLLLPLHRRYNELVGRLAELEAAHEARADSLHAEVRAATHTLLEQQRSLARAERLAATGELAASMAHELRNPLAGIHMTLSNLRTELQEPELVERIDRVLKEVDRLTRLLGQLLDAARHAPEPARDIMLEPLVEDVLTLTRYQVPAHVRLVNHIDPQLRCRLPQDRLRQVLLNLVLNAAFALGDSAGTVEITAAADSAHLQISVADDGPGFPESVLQEGGRPFVSTRAGGTGLGLAMVRRFARDAGGELVIANRERGAQVTLRLPLSAPTE